MTRRRRSGAILPGFLGLALAGCGGHEAPAPAPAPAVEHIRHGRFEDVALYAPAAASPPSSVVLLLSGAGGWDDAASQWATQLTARGALVIGIDSHQFRAALDGDGGDCVFPDGDLENLGHFVQAYRHLPTYRPPLLAGIDAGASLAYATLAQAPRGLFAGALSRRFCPSLELARPPCAGPGGEPVATRAGAVLQLAAVRALPAPWIATRAAPGAPAGCPASQHDAFVRSVPGASAADDVAWATGFDRLVAGQAAPAAASTPAALPDLPLVEVPVPGRTAPNGTVAILLSGDGGWAGLDKEVAAALAAQGFPVVGLDSLRYFWTARTPDGIAADLDRIIAHYVAAWQARDVLLIGYSQGADVLPFAVNRLGAATRANVTAMVVLGLSAHAQFEFHIGNWLGDDESGPATLPEINRISGPRVVCIYGGDDADALCPQLDARRFTVLRLAGGHHFDGDYAALAGQIIAAARPGRTGAPRPAG